jgi:hypothetical protein
LQIEHETKAGKKNKKNLIAYAMADDVAVSSPQPGLQKQQRVIDCSITLFETHPA